MLQDLANPDESTTLVKRAHKLREHHGIREPDRVQAPLNDGRASESVARGVPNNKDESVQQRASYLIQKHQEQSAGQCRYEHQAVRVSQMNCEHQGPGTRHAGGNIMNCGRIIMSASTKALRRAKQLVSINTVGRAISEVSIGEYRASQAL